MGYVCVEIKTIKTMCLHQYLFPSLFFSIFYAILFIRRFLFQHSSPLISDLDNTNNPPYLFNSHFVLTNIYYYLF